MARFLLILTGALVALATPKPASASWGASSPDSLAPRTLSSQALQSFT